MDRINALVLAGGFGTRLRPLTNEVPKCLVTIDGVSLLERWVCNLKRAGISEVVVNTHHLRKKVQAFLTYANEKYDFKITESFESKLLGSAGTVSNNESLSKDVDSVVLIYADNLSGIEIKDLVAYHSTHDFPITMMLFHTPKPHSCGIAKLDDSNTVVNFVEKPKNPEGNLANAGIYIIDSGTYREIAKMGVFDFGFDVLPKYIGSIKGFVFDGYHRDIGDLASLEQAQQDVSNRDIEIK